MHNIIIVDNDFTNISRIISIFHPIEDAKVKSLFHTCDEHLKSTFGDLSNIYVLFEETYFTFHSIFPENLKIIILVNNRIQSKVTQNILHVSLKTANATLRKNISSYLNVVPKYSYQDKVRKILNNLKFDFKLNGTHYLYDSIIYCINIGDDVLCENLQQNVFNIIAKQHNTTANNVKWSIFRSINKAYKTACNTDIKRINKYFRLETNQKPTPKRVICTILNKIDRKIY